MLLKKSPVNIFRKSKFSSKPKIPGFILFIVEHYAIKMDIIR